MKRLTKAVLLFAGLVLAAQAARAQVNQGDLVLGFTQASNPGSDYVIDLGAFSSFNNTQIYQLGSMVSLSTFNSVISQSSGPQAGAVAGQEAATTGDFIVASVLRTGNNAEGVAGTESVPNQPSGGNNVTSAATSAVSLSTGTPAASSGTSFTTASQTLTAGTLANAIQLNPSVAMTGNIVALDLWESTRLAPVGRGNPASAFTYVGQLDIDMSGSTPSVEFIGAGFAAAVPEPASFGILAGAGVLLLSLRRQLGRFV